MLKCFHTNVTTVLKHYCAPPHHGLGKPSLPAHCSQHWWSFSILYFQEAHLWVSQTNHPGTEQVQWAGGTCPSNTPHKPSSMHMWEMCHIRTFFSSPFRKAVIATLAWLPTMLSFFQQKTNWSIQYSPTPFNKTFFISINVSICTQSQQLTEQDFPLMVKVSMSSYIIWHSVDEICHHTPSLQPTIRYRAISTESSELSLMTPCQETFHISDNWSSLGGCKYITLQVATNLWGRQNKSEILANVSCLLSAIAGVPTCNHSGNTLFPSPLNDMDYQLVLQHRLLKTSPSKVYGTEQSPWSQLRKLFTLIWVQVILKPLITPCTFTV